jgi:Xaa-Pro aminopeptidase
MKEKEADYFVLGSLDDIAWAFNIRGADVLYTPVIISYALISMDKAYFFVDEEKINKDVKVFLNENNVNIKPYKDIEKFLSNIENNSGVFLDKSMTNRYIYNAIPENTKIISDTNITTNLKGNKNETEVENQKNAYIKDGVALSKFLYWIDNNIGKEKITEISASDKLLKLRKEQEGFIEPSFSTISAYGANAAMAHYSAKEDSFSILEEKGLYLVDSGGQYLDGTTDITRTIALGDITDEEKRDFTLTLKGHINLSDAKFLKGTNGYQLDILCRNPLWQEGLDFKHGTGHGVGYLLGVHEGPHRIANSPNDVSLEKGMIVSIEPGVYKAGKHGIRIENIVVVDEDMETESGEFLRFETLSYVPIDLKAIDTELLNKKEKSWLNDYHREVFEKISPYLNKDEKEWLEENTRKI